MVFPMSQHIGAPATPCVKVTDRVLKGMKIGEASGFVSSPVYSSVSGTVMRIEDRTMLNGKTSKCVVIKNDFEDECVEGFGISREVNALSNYKNYFRQRNRRYGWCRLSYRCKTFT